MKFYKLKKNLMNRKENNKIVEIYFNLVCGNVQNASADGNQIDADFCMAVFDCWWYIKSHSNFELSVLLFYVVRKTASFVLKMLFIWIRMSWMFN